MAKYLFIIESPGKLKKISSFLGKEYKILATFGHISDLAKKNMGVNLKKDFEPTYEISADKKDVVNEIIKEAKKAEMVYIATDKDREGSGICKSIVNILPSGIQYKRVVYGSITKDVILSAIENAGSVDENMVNSYECRRILDRVAGWKTSFVTQQATGGKSAGRVQSAGLRILAEREAEIKSFIPKEYWPIEVTLERKNGEQFIAYIKVPDKLEISNKEASDLILKNIKKGKWKVSKFETNEKSSKPYPPFTTSTLYQAASSILNWDSKKTAFVAQKLYENSNLTYIRSDSTFIIPEVIEEFRSFSRTKYGCNYLPSNPNTFASSKNAQEAHEAIRIVHVNDESISSELDNQKLYTVVWKRSVASQISDMKQFVSKVEITCCDYIFSASGSKIIFDGWTKVWDYGNYDNSELPIMKEGELLTLIDVKTEQKFTSPPPRYSEASFIKELEKRGIGRPSTYKTIVEVLKDRAYVNVEKRMFHVTEMGERVNNFLVGANICFSDLNFSASLEEDLDRIANNETTKLSVLGHFWERLQSDLQNAKTQKDTESHSGHPCPKCHDGELLKKFSKFGAFYACSNRTNKENMCDYKCSIGENLEPVEQVKKVLEESEFTCPNCGEKLIKRTSKKNWEYLSCKNWKNDKKCEGFLSKDTGEKIVFKKKKFFKKYKKKNTEEE